MALGLTISNLPLAFYQRQPGLGLQKEFSNFYSFLWDSNLSFYCCYRRDDGGNKKSGWPVVLTSDVWVLIATFRGTMPR